MSIVFYIFAALLIYFSFRSFRGGFDYLNYFKGSLAQPQSTFAPFATIIAPCKGIDDGLAENLAALFDQEYPEYEIIFVVDNENDDAIPIIKNVVARNSGKERNSLIVIAPTATDSSQKVENLRAAVLHADARSEIFVFVDSDARPARHWISDLVGPLSDKSVGVTTGYRWFIAKTPSLATEIRAMWNASVASSLGPNDNGNFCWGGSMAIARETFDKVQLRERWRGTVSDDFVVRTVLREAGLGIRFVPQALTASVENCTFREMLEFTTRQMKLTRVYATPFWIVSFIGSGLFVLVMSSAIMATIFAPATSLLFWAAIATLALVTIFSVGKSILRQKAVGLVLRQYEGEIKRQTLPQCVLWLIAQPIFFYNCIAALFSRRIHWRGKCYEMVSASKTDIVHQKQTQ